MSEQENKIIRNIFLELLKKYGNQVVHEGDCFYHFRGDSLYFSFDGYELKGFEKELKIKLEYLN